MWSKWVVAWVALVAIYKTWVFISALTCLSRALPLARHFNLGVPYALELKIPGDLIDGAISRDAGFKTIVNPHCDFILADLEEMPLAAEAFDGSIALNTIDMLDDPELLPKLQFQSVKKNGFAIQSCPYIWQTGTVKKLKKVKVIQGGRNSAAVVEKLYQDEGFKLIHRNLQIPWLFLKHFRQLEIYSVHAFVAQKK